MNDVKNHNISAVDSAPLALTSRVAAELLSISERTLYTLTKRGLIRCKKIGRAVRYYRPDLIEFMERDHGKHHL